MSESELWDAPAIVPSLAYEDVPKAVEWLTRAFGFEERSEARLSWPGGSMAWLEVGGGLIHISTSGGHEIYSPQSIEGISGLLKVYVDDVDRHFAQATAAGAEILSEIEEGFWGGRYYRAIDFEGHRWEFSQQGKERAAESLAATVWLKKGQLMKYMPPNKSLERDICSVTRLALYSTNAPQLRR